MKIYRSLDELPGPIPGACVTLGNFDGVHLGHARLFAEVVRRARERGGSSVVLTFSPHPLKVLRPEGIKLISTCEQKAALIEAAGIDVLVILPFTREFAATPARDFVDRILVERIGVRDLVVGYDYAFGRGREGDIDFLRSRGRHWGFPVTVVEALYVDGVIVSSTKVRELVSQGRMRDVARLLGRYYQIHGTVRRGKQRGGPVVGFPTANLALDEDDLIPRLGVYVTQVICMGRCWGGVLNIGYNPTFGDGALVAETHIFDFNRDIYGREIKINLLRHLRGEQRFNGVDELSAQIRRDIAEARKVLEASRRDLLISCNRELGEDSGEKKT